LKQSSQRKQKIPQAAPKSPRMPRSQRVVLSIVLVYCCLALFIAFINRDQTQSIFTISRLFQRAEFLQSITNCVQRDSVCIPLSAYCRNIAEQLPVETRVFMTHMLGPENGSKLGYYYFMANYLFPREVGISFRTPVTFHGDYYEGSNPTNNSELGQAGYNFAFDLGAGNQIAVAQLAPLNVPPSSETNKICKNSDALVAGLLPLLVTGFGMWLLPILFGFKSGTMELGERFACGLAIGSLFVSQTLFGFRLIGLGCERILFWALLLGMVALVIYRWKSIKAVCESSMKQWVTPASLLISPHLILFIAILWLAGLAGLSEFDAVAGWALKAKIIFLNRGHEIVKWFSEPRLAHAHLDYPILVPTLHAFTYGVLGRVNEFVTKFWPAWMAVALVIGVLSMCGFPKRNRFLAAAVTLVVLCMPVTMQFVQGEGATIPSMFFMGLGCMECTFAMINSDKKRFWVGMIILLAAAMTKFEGAIILILWVAAAICRTKTRNLLFVGRRECVILGLALLLVLPYSILKLQIPQLHPDQGAFQTLRQHSLKIAGRVPVVLATMIARECVDKDVVAWTVSNEGKPTWSGRWVGWQGLINTFNLGWGWLCIALTAALVFWRATRRHALVLTVIALGFFAFIAAIYCGLPYLFTNFQGVIDITGDLTGHRHVAPMFVAWGLSLIVLAISTMRATNEKVD
jgi:hypothetical protein